MNSSMRCAPALTLVCIATATRRQQKQLAPAMSATDHLVVLSKVTPRQVPLLFKAFPPGSIDMDRSVAKVALDAKTRKPIAALILHSEPTSNGIGLFRFQFLTQQSQAYAHSFFEQLDYLAIRHGYASIAAWGARKKDSDDYNLLCAHGYEPKEQLLAFELRGKDKIKALYDDKVRLFEALKARGDIPKQASVVSFAEASAEAVSSLIATGLGSARTEIDHSPLSGIDLKRSVVLKIDHIIVAATLIRALPDGKGFYVSASAVEPEYKVTWATPYINRALLQHLVDAEAEYYAFETNPGKSPKMVNFAKRYHFKELGSSHLLVKALQLSSAPAPETR